MQISILAIGSIILFNLISFMIYLALMSRTYGTLKIITTITTLALSVLMMFKSKIMKKKANLRTYSDILAYFDGE